MIVNYFATGLLGLLWLILLFLGGYTLYVLIKKSLIKETLVTIIVVITIILAIIAVGAILVNLFGIGIIQ